MANFNYNRVILGGRLTSDPELKTTNNGTAWCSFTVAVNRPYTGKDNQDQQTTDFINCVAWRQRAEFVSKYFKKGSSIAVEGAIQVRSWTDQNGQKRYTTEIVIDNAMFVDAKGESRGSLDNNSQPSYSSQPDEPKFDDISNDDDLPF